ncbi:MAG: retropepsin-like aspartic protease [Bryobacteraceae bacterium]
MILGRSIARAAAVLVLTTVSPCEAETLTISPLIFASGGCTAVRFAQSWRLQYFSDAFRLAPDDPEVIREYALTTQDAGLALALWRRLLRTPTAPDAWRQQAKERLEVATALRGRESNRLLSAYRRYSIRMPAARAMDSRPLGWVLRVRINGHTLRLLVDTGSRGILISRSQARRLGLETLAPTLHAGFGDERPRAGWIMAGRDLEIDGVEFENPIVEATSHEVAPGTDGLIGIGLFRDFVITLDGPGHRLLLEPRGEADGRPANLRRAGHLLLASGGLGGRTMRVLLDSGAAFSILDGDPDAVTPDPVSLSGISGGVKAGRVMERPVLDSAGYRGPLQEAVYADLRRLGEDLGARVDAVAGFPLLRTLVTRIDLQRGRIEMRTR